MLNYIKKLVQQVFSQPSELETYIASKNPQNAGEVEHWMRVYAHKEGF